MRASHRRPLQANGWDASDEGAVGTTSTHVAEEMPQLAAITELPEIRVVESDSLTIEQKASVAAVFKGLDSLGDKNSQVGKSELSPLDKRGKLFSSMEVTAEGFITLNAFESFFMNLAKERGEKSAMGLLKHVETYVQKQTNSVKKVAAVKDVEMNKKGNMKMRKSW